MLRHEHRWIDRAGCTPVAVDVDLEMAVRSVRIAAHTDVPNRLTRYDLLSYHDEWAGFHVTVPVNDAPDVLNLHVRFAISDDE